MTRTFFLTGLITALIASVIFSLGVNAAIQMTSIVNTGFYRIFKDGVVLGNIKHYDDITNEVKERYGDKVSDEFYFGDGISMEYAAYENPIELSNVADLMNDLAIEVQGLRVSTDTGKEFHVTSYRDWQEALADVVDFVKDNDKSTRPHATLGDVRVMDNFYYSYERIPIEEAKDQREVEQALLFADVMNMQVETVGADDTLASIAQRHNIPEAQLAYVNNIGENVSLLPGATLNVSPIDYAVDFVYPFIENTVEDIPFEIEYIDDAESYIDQIEVLQAGVNGQADAQYLSYIMNGESVPTEQMSYIVRREPVKQIVRRGTKRRVSRAIGADAPYAATSGLIWPTTGICTSAEYLDPSYKREIGRDHYGFDIAGNYREDVWVVADGTVESTGFAGAFGNQVMVDHHNGLKTRYAHLSSIAVNPGAAISQGKYIGGMGRSGAVTGTHLHFEVHVDGNRVNPRLYLPKSGIPNC